MRVCTLSTILLLALPAVALSGDWPMFRGPSRNGLSAETGIPQTWGRDQNIKWKAPLPGPGNSSPVVSHSKVYVTCATERGKNRGLYCFDRETGKQLWEKIVRYEEEDPTHGTNPYCGSSPAADGERVVVWHGSAGVHAYDYEGKELWSRDLGKFTHIWGYGSSPVIYQNMFLLNCGPGERQFVIALDCKSGETIWETDIPGGESGLEREQGKRGKWIGSWATPLVIKVGGQEQILISLPHQAQAFDPKSGKVVWSCEGLGDLCYTDALAGETAGLTMGGFHGPAIGFKFGGEGDVTETNRLWRQAGGNPQRIGSGVIIGNHVFMANEPGIVQCLELESGRELWKDRLPGANIWASIVATEGRLYVTNQAGTTHVFAANPEKFELLASNDVNEQTNSTLALSDGQIFLRTFKNLICIDEP